MLTPPEDVSEQDVAELLANRHAITASSVEYLAVGFGSHNYRVTDAAGSRWFVKIERETGPDRVATVTAAYATAVDVAERCDLDFLITPVGPIAELSRRGVAVFPHVDGEPAGPGTHYPSEGDRAEVASMIGRLHACPPSDLAGREDFVIPLREELIAVKGTETGWDRGPHGPSTRYRLAANAGRIADMFARYDELVDAVDHDGWVVTHGEPHSSNVIRDRTGALYLADLDTMLLAPRERDLWDLDTDVPGPRPRPELLELYRLRWDLGEIAEYAVHFHGPHDGSPDDEIRWRELEAYLPI